MRIAGFPSSPSISNRRGPAGVLCLQLFVLPSVVVLVMMMMMTMMMPSLSGVAVVDALPSSYFADGSYPQSCMASQRAPDEPRPLEFCFWQNSRSCCTPANDAKAKAAFQDFTDLGPGCAPTDHKIRASYREVRQFACLACDPDEPRYRVDKRNGDTHLPGGTIAPDGTAVAGDFVWRVCMSFVFGKDGKSGLWGQNGSKFNACGIRPFGGTPDFTVPSVAYEHTNRKTIADQFVAVLPSFLPGFKAVIIDDFQPTFNRTATPCFQGAGAVSALVVPLVAVFVIIIMMFSF